jgi:hypothetical protein
MVGAGISAAGTIGAAKANEKAAQAQWWNDLNGSIYNQKALQQQASEERFGAQQRALQFADQEKRVQSSLKANAAFGGGSATDDTVAKLGGEIGQVGSFQKAMSMFAGESRARGLEDAGTAGVYRAVNQGNMDVWKAGMNTRAARASAMGSLIGSAGGLFNAVGNTDFSKYSIG